MKDEESNYDAALALLKRCRGLQMNEPVRLGVAIGSAIVFALLAIVDAVHDLDPAMTTLRNAYTGRMVARFGFTASQASVCPRVVAGKRCLVGYSRLGVGRHCICLRWAGTILDHARIWRRAGESILTAEPYGLDPKTVEAFRQEIAPLGLELEVTDESYWFSGTRLLLIRRKRAE